MDWNFSDSEKAFWLDRISSVTIPYEYGYHTGWEMLLSCLELFAIGMIGICICVSGTFSIFTLLLSVKMRSAVPVLVIIVFAFMMPMFIGISETNGIWNRIFVLLPYRATQPVFSDDFFGYFGYPIGGLTFNVVTVRMLLYAAVTLICVPFARKAWKGHQVV